MVTIDGLAQTSYQLKSLIEMRFDQPKRTHWPACYTTQQIDFGPTRYFLIATSGEVCYEAFDPSHRRLCLCGAICANAGSARCDSCCLCRGCAEVLRRSAIGGRPHGGLPQGAQGLVVRTMQKCSGDACEHRQQFCARHGQHTGTSRNSRRTHGPSRSATLRAECPAHRSHSRPKNIPQRQSCVENCACKWCPGRLLSAHEASSDCRARG